jgi:formate C-acetyltransferase
MEDFLMMNKERYDTGNVSRMLDVSLDERQVQRIKKIKDSLLDSAPGICTERLRIYTNVYEEYASYVPVLRRAKALVKYLGEMTIYLRDEDLIPGYQSSRPRYAPIFPEYSWDWVYDEIDRFDKRKYDRFQISDEAKQDLRTYLPRWKNKSLYENISAAQTDVVKKAAQMGVMSWTGQATSGEGHIAIDYPTALRKGFTGIREEAREKLNALRLYEPDDLRKKAFYEAVTIIYDGILLYLGRLSNVAVEQLGRTGDVARKAELSRMVSALEDLRKGPPQNFYEAIIAVWLIHLIQQIESNGHSTSLGRFDQYLNPFLLNDLRNGSLSSEEALEMIEHFYLKLFSIIKIRPAKHSRTQSGYPMYQNLVVGGITPQGEDAVNEMSCLCLRAVEDVRLSEPNFYIRLNTLTPDWFLAKAIEVVKLGTGMPAFVNDKVIIPSLRGRGVDPKDANNYSTMGCLEVLVPGKWGYRANGKSKLNLLKILELVLNDGTDPKTSYTLKKGIGRLPDIDSFDALMCEWREQVKFYTQVHVTADNINDAFLETLVPNAFCSSLVQDCLGRGKTLNEGGAIYDMTSGALVGLPNVGNTLAVIKKLIYESKVLSADELMRVIENNFEGPEDADILSMLKNQAPKYGEDEDYADDLAVEALSAYTDIIADFKDMRYGRGPIGGTYYPSTVTISANVASGFDVGATPDGRKDAEPLADGVSPSHGTGKEGPTAIIHSVTKLPTVEMTGGQLLNLRITNVVLGTEAGRKKLAALIRTFFDMNGWHVQFNCVSTKILKDAMAHPDKYKDLIVRVAGYSAQFVSLDPVLQMDIISRMEHNL